MQLFSPAKINLFLRILGKRPDGYHELASLFQAINWGDKMTFTFAKQDALTCSNPLLPCDQTNLVTKAVDLYRRKTGKYFHIHIHLEKCIPTQAGLGGGSSNAATTLWALNALHNYFVDEKELQIWSAEIGSDIPFFFSHGTAYCTGRGEKVQNLSALPQQHFSVVKPPEGLSTQLIFNNLNLSACSKKDPGAILATFHSKTPYYINDLETPAFRLCPSLAALKEKLMENKSQSVFMTGTGSALVCKQKVGTPIQFINRTPQSWY